jgi:uncharacterized protein (DUF1015 family)
VPILDPFAGVRYAATDELKDLVCPPYDIISPAQQTQLYDRHLNNAVRLELPIGDDATTKFEGAARDFASWLDSGVLRRDPSPHFYVYRQDFVWHAERRSITGVLGALRLEDFGTDSGVLPHERTMAGPKADRLALMTACPVNISPIYAIFRGAGGLAPFYASLESRPPQARFQDDDGILHRLWAIEAKAELDALADAVAATTLVIADGHHRYETALAFHRERGDDQSGAIMCFCVDADAADLVVLPYNRAITADGNSTDIAARLRDRFDARPLEGDHGSALAGSTADHPFVFVTPSGRLLVEVSDERVVAAVGDRAPAWRALDVVALHEAVLPEVAPGSEFAFSKDPDEVISMVSRGEAAAGVLLKALRATDVVEVARSGERMPQKASYFWPKAITGLVFREL